MILIEGIYTTRVRYHHVDRMDVVYHSRYLELFEEARVEVLRQHGLIYAEVEKQGIILPVLKVELTYRRPAHLDDSLLIKCRIQTNPAEKKFLTTTYSVYRENDPALLVQGQVILGFVDAQTKRLIDKPKGFFSPGL